MTAGHLTKLIAVSVAVVAVAASIEWIDVGRESSAATCEVWNAGAGSLQHAITQAPPSLAIDTGRTGASTGPAGKRTVTRTAPRSRLVPQPHPSDGTIAPVAGQIGSSKTIGVTMTVPAATTGKTSTASWQNTALARQSGAFSAEFDAVPNAAGMDGLIGMSTAPGSAYGDFAVTVRFNSQNRIDVRNGGTYAAANAVAYTPGKNCHFRVVVNVPAHTCSVYVTLQDGTEQTLATNYAFRTEQAAVTSLANWGLYSDIGSVTVRNLAVTPQALPLAASAGGNKTVPAGRSCTLNGAATGGTSPYAYRWAPTTGLSNAAIASPTASPTATTTYTLTVSDQVSRTATATAVVTVTPAITGTTCYVDKAHGSDANPGTADAPFKTLSKAAMMAMAGTTVIVKPGTYYEALILTRSGTSDNPIVFQSETPRGAVIDGQNTRSIGVDIDGQKYVRIDGFEVRYHAGDAICCQSYYGDTAEGQEVVNNYIHHNGNYTSWGGGYGIQASNLRNSLIAGNEIYHNGDTAIRLGGSGAQTDGVTIRGNSIHYNGRDGVDISGSNITVEFNHMYDQEHTLLHQDALQIWMCNGLIVRYNIMGDFTQLVYGGLNAGTTETFVNLQVYGNVFYNCLRYARRGAAVAGVWIDCRDADMGNQFGNIQIHSNTFLFLGDGQTPIQLYGSESLVMDDVRIYNNIFYCCGGDSGGWVYGIDSRFTNVRADYNCLYNVTANCTGQDTHSITADPRLTNYTLKAVPVDVRLLPGSPCINTGAPTLSSLVTLPNPFVDRDNHARPTGGTYDIGAYEY